jgi:hypothetical protein
LLFLLSVAFLLEDTGGFYYEKFKLLYETRYEKNPEEDTDDEEGGREEQQQVNEIMGKERKSRFRENQEIHQKIINQMNALQTTPTKGDGETETDHSDQTPESVEGIRALFCFAKLCFDVQQKNILRMKLPFQWFTVIALRVRKHFYFFV